MKFLKNILLVIGILSIIYLVVAGGIFAKNFVHEKGLLNVSQDSVRVQAIGFGHDKNEAELDAAARISENSIDKFSVVEIKEFSFKSGGDTVWICDIAIDVKKSDLHSPVAPQKLNLTSEKFNYNFGKFD